MSPGHGVDPTHHVGEDEQGMRREGPQPGCVIFGIPDRPASVDVNFPLT
jgi:hypothetical protein